jgi:hypothetical protein
MRLLLDYELTVGFNKIITSRNIKYNYYELRVLGQERR